MTPLTPGERLIEATFSLMKHHASLAGQILLEMQPHIHNIGKKGDSIHAGELDAGGTYKTVMDDLLQEAFLARLLSINPFARVNAEEETPLLKIFSGNDGKVCTVHQDPLDGTKSYVRQNPEFALGFAISQHNNLFPYSVVGIPARKMVYAASPAGAEIYEVMDGPAKKDIAELIGRICELQEMAKRKEAACIFGGDSEINTLSRKIVSEINFLRPAPELKEASSKRAAGELPDGIDGQGISPNEVYGKRISPKGAYDKKIFPNVIYNKRILSDEQKKAIANLGFRIGEMRSAHTRIIDVALDEAAAVLYGNGNPHDVMIPFAFARSYGAKASARGGEEISGKDLIERVVDGRLKFERIPSLCYFSPHACSSGMADKILGAIKN